MKRRFLIWAWGRCALYWERSEQRWIVFGNAQPLARQRHSARQMATNASRNAGRCRANIELLRRS